jgi:hypothetical protein
MKQKIWQENFALFFCDISHVKRMCGIFKSFSYIRRYVARLEAENLEILTVLLEFLKITS